MCPKEFILPQILKKLFFPTKRYNNVYKIEEVKIIILKKEMNL